MAKLPLTFKEKHLCFAANYLKNTAAVDSFDTLLLLKTVLENSNVQPEDEIQVEVNGDVIVNIYLWLGSQQERIANSNNTEMALALKTQLEALALLENEIGDEARSVAQRLSEIKAANLAEQESYIEAGRSWLRQ